MPILCFRKKVKFDKFEEVLSFSFNCIYDDEYHLKLKDSTYFDSGDFNIRIDEAILKLSNDIIKEYQVKNKGIWYMALLNYFYDNLPGLYSIKFESDGGDSIYYVDDLK